LFTLFWEAMLLPVYFIIGMWGREQCKKAAIQFLLYMLAGSLFLVAAVLALYLGTHSFNIDELAASAVQLPQAKWIFLVFILAFAVKTPLFPFHAWLPNAYTRSSISGTLLLSALLSKAGIFGIVRLIHPLFPTLLEQWSPLLFTLAIVGVIYGGWAACTQKDFKRLIAYSSFSHVNFVLAGLFVWHATAHTGALLQAFNHGITIAGLFLTAHWLEQRIGETMITERRGLAKFMPQLCWLTLVFVLSSVALPGTNSFVGEILILFGSFQTFPWLTPFLGLTVIISVVYSLRLMQKIYFEVPSKHEERWTDIQWKEWALSIPLLVFIIWVGIYPAPFLKCVQKETAHKKTVSIEPLIHETKDLNIRK
ncbi:MAG: NADH-quinone oxidoreductase subunit M, partial [Chlamydiia bacterium]|nr:NADH-quinone oxidoreductase subunit M [Chlamydiia bacterium]